MSETLTVDAEFLRRALGFGQGGDPEDVQVTPGTLPPDFPVPLPGWPEMRVLGGVQGAAKRWQFFGDARGPGPGAHWRAFLDVPGMQLEVMAALLEQLEAHGWQAARPFTQTFVEAERRQWMGVHEAEARTLRVFAHQAGGQTQLWLTVEDAEAGQLGHLLGRSHPHFPAMFEAPLPTLTLPPGWAARMQSGTGGPIRSETLALQSPASPPDQESLLTHLLPQFGRQGWRLLHREDGGPQSLTQGNLTQGLTVYRTALGTGTLLLRAEEGGITATLVHVTGEQGPRSTRMM